MKKFKFFLKLILVIDVVLTIVILTPFYKSYPNVDFFNQRKFSDRNWLSKGFINVYNINKIQFHLNQGISFLQKPRKEAEIIYKMTGIFLREKLNGNLQTNDDGDWVYSESVSNKNRSRIDAELNSATKEYEKIAISDEKQVLISNKKHNVSSEILFNLEYFKKLNELDKNHFSKNSLIVNTIVNLKSMFGVLNENETEFINEVNFCYSTFPILCSNNSGLDFEVDNYQDLSIKLAQHFFGLENSISHGYINSNCIANIQLNNLKKFSEPLGLELSDNYLNSVNEIENSKSYNSVSFFADFIYYSFITSLFLVIVLWFKSKFWKN